MHTTIPRHSCDSLGVCQQRVPACNGCTCHADAIDPDHTDTTTHIERIGYWLCVTMAVGLSVAITFGAAGYLAVKLLA